MNSPLVDLSKVRTEQATLLNLEDLSCEDRCAVILRRMREALHSVQRNKVFILQAVEMARGRLQEILPQSRRLHIVGAGTSGRLAALVAREMLDHTEFHVSFNMAGGPSAFQSAVEGAEDDEKLAREDVDCKTIDQNSVVIGVSASGRTPYTLAYIKASKEAGAMTIGIDNSPGSPLSKIVDLPVSNDTGPEYPRGSTRMKAGTSQHITLQLFTRMLCQTLSDKTSDFFDVYTKNLDKSLHALDEGHLTVGARSLASHFSQFHAGRLVYRGDGLKGLLGVIDGSELGPTYGWSRVAHIVPHIPTTSLSSDDFVITLGKGSSFKDADLCLENPDDVCLGIMLKTVTTLFALQSGWILEGEMIALNPKNPNQKLIARRVQTLKNLKVSETDAQALDILKTTENNLALAVLMHRRGLSLEKAKRALSLRQNNVVQALKI